MGKSRLLGVIGEEASHTCEVVACRAFPIGTSVPYALFSDGFVPLLNATDASTLAVLARGHEGRLAHLFPAFDGAEPVGATHQTQLFWTFAEFLRAWSARKPVVLLLDDLHWADAASIELFHFLCRQLKEDPVAILATINDGERDAHPSLRTVVQSLRSLNHVDEQPLTPLEEADIADLIGHVFGVDHTVTSRFTGTLYRWTRGNPFFVKETLGELVASGRLRQEGGSWIGWETDDLSLPRSIREAVELQLERLSGDARTVAESCAIIGADAELRTLRAVCDMEERALIDAIEALRGTGVLAERGTPDRPTYDFRHPMHRQVLLERIGLARRQYLHERVARALEAQYGDHALERAEALAHHWIRAQGDDTSNTAGLRYLIAAGESALGRFADREADLYLSAALSQLESCPDETLVELGGAELVSRVLRRLASARQRRGRFADAAELRDRAYRDYVEAGDEAGAAHAMRRIGLAHFWAGRRDEAMESYGRALTHATSAGDDAILAAVRMALGSCLQTLGRVDEARAELERALEHALSAQDDALEARVRIALTVLHTMIGPPDVAREHGRRALAIAEKRSDASSVARCHWALGTMEGINGHARRCADHIARGSAVADELGDPLLRLALDEVAIEWAFSSGDWDTGLALGERAIALSHSLNQRRLLPRLYVWTSLVYLGRYATDRAKGLLDEAWELSGADDPARAPDINSVIVAHTGMANYHRTLWQWDKAIDVARRGMEVVDTFGFTAWGVHRLLPTIIESHLYRADAEAAASDLERLRSDAVRLGHVLGLAWADAGDALVEWIRGDLDAAIRMLRNAAERLEAVPFVWDAARVRRQLAGRLADAGRRDEAIHELRTVHDVFVRLGASFELDKTREQLRDLGARPPVRSAGQGTQALTDRELDIVRLVATGASNKAIARELEISPRTVTTHLSNVYKKLEIGSRAELAEMAPAFLTAGGS